jgi:hypothetical protein
MIDYHNKAMLFTKQITVIMVKLDKKSREFRLDLDIGILKISNQSTSGSGSDTGLSSNSNE